MTDASNFGHGQLPTDAEVDELLHPSRLYARPADVIADELLTLDERRAILSSWASDACAVESNPLLRQAPYAQAPVTFDEIMDALMQLDRLNSRSRRAPRAAKTIVPALTAASSGTVSRG